MAYIPIYDKDGIERFKVNPKTNRMLNRIKDKINKEDQEVWIAVGGNTGTGKSLLAQRLAYVINPSLDISMVCFSKDEFIKAVLKAKKGECIIADEAISIFFSRGSMTKEGRLMGELINQIRQKNLCVFVCVPDVLNLDGIVKGKVSIYLEVYETRTKTGDGFRTVKGNYNVFIDLPRKPLKTLYFIHKRKKKFNPMAKSKRPKPYLTCYGDTITKKEPWYPVGAKEYKEKKESVLKKYDLNNDGKIDSKEARGYEKLHASDAYRHDILGESFALIGKTTDRTRQTVFEGYKRYKERMEGTPPLSSVSKM